MAKRVVDHLPDNEASTIDFFRPLVLTVRGILEKDEGFLRSWRRHMKKSVYDFPQSKISNRFLLNKYLLRRDQRIIVLQWTALATASFPFRPAGTVVMGDFQAVLAVELASLARIEKKT